MGGSFSKKPQFDPSKDIPDLTGKVAIVTGGNAGLGYATVQHLVRHGAKVYIGARSEERAKAAIERLRAEGLQPGNGELEWLEVNLSDPAKAKQAAEAFLQKESRLDILVNNAGVMRIPYNVDGKYGIHENMLVNHVSPFVFTNTLKPLLTKTAKELGSDVRVVMVSSHLVSTLKGRDIRFRDVNDFNEKFGNNIYSDMRRYALSKLANILFAKEFQRRVDFEGIPITALSIDPGSVNTEGVYKDPSLRMPIIGPIFKLLFPRIFLTPTVGAYPSVFAAASPVVKEEKDKYKGACIVPPCKLAVPPCPHAENKELAEELWNTTETILKKFAL
ncbi:NAD-P-binding protein [Trametes coccinea BRFM310]|uniref:NAD-P-binding protein n=1 Tax=Trametes coccinea (strain BRFM310) TaxID=1353009 RepID=A0A1Y2J7H5_TRAC3|nr:NAD-P-binding protein [Trametes coccinea BRFM310]